MQSMRVDAKDSDAIDDILMLTQAHTANEWTEVCVQADWDTDLDMETFLPDCECADAQSQLDTVDAYNASMECDQSDRSEVSSHLNQYHGRCLTLPPQQKRLSLRHSPTLACTADSLTNSSRNAMLEFESWSHERRRQATYRVLFGRPLLPVKSSATVTHPTAAMKGGAMQELIQSQTSSAAAKRSITSAKRSSPLPFLNGTPTKKRQAKRVQTMATGMAVAERVRGCRIPTKKQVQTKRTRLTKNETRTDPLLDALLLGDDLVELPLTTVDNFCKSEPRASTLKVSNNSEDSCPVPPFAGEIHWKESVSLWSEALLEEEDHSGGDGALEASLFHLELEICDADLSFGENLEGWATPTESSCPLGDSAMNGDLLAFLDA
ncbi:hypothetical protein FI667_g7111, partial [Globisporangium splendens]